MLSQDEGGQSEEILRCCLGLRIVLL